MYIPYSPLRIGLSVFGIGRSPRAALHRLVISKTSSSHNILQVDQLKSQTPHSAILGLSDVGSIGIPLSCVPAVVCQRANGGVDIPEFIYPTFGELPIIMIEWIFPVQTELHRNVSPTSDSVQPYSQQVHMTRYRLRASQHMREWTGVRRMSRLTSFKTA